MFQSTQDIFYIVLAFCVLWLTVFLCWSLYYLMKLLKQANDLVGFWRERLARVTSIFELIKNKAVGAGVGALMSFVTGKNKKEKNKNK